MIKAEEPLLLFRDRVLSAGDESQPHFVGPKEAWDQNHTKKKHWKVITHKTAFWNYLVKLMCRGY